MAKASMSVRRFLLAARPPKEGIASVNFDFDAFCSMHHQISATRFAQLSKTSKDLYMPHRDTKNEVSRDINGEHIV